MAGERKYFIKLAIILFAVILVQSIWKIAVVWKPGVWILLGVCVFLAIVRPLGRLAHAPWLAYLKRTEEYTRFFQGMGLFLLLIAFYRLFYLEPGRGWEGLKALFAFSPPGGDYRYFGGVGLFFLIASAIPPLSRFIFGAWMKFAELLRSVVSRVILLLVYVLSVLPVGLIARLAGKRFLKKELEPERESYWEDRPSREFDPARYRRHF